MKIKQWIVVLVLTLLTPATFAEDKYKGSISVNIREDGGSAYTTSTGFETLEGKDVIFSFRRAGGLKAKYSKGALHTEPFKQNYYHFILNIYNVSNDVFKAEIKLYSNTIRLLNKKLEGISKQNLIIEYDIEGMLFTKNEYLLSDKDSPDINVILEFDKIFSAEEIKERLQQKHITRTWSGFHKLCEFATPLMLGVEAVEFLQVVFSIARRLHRTKVARVI